MRTQRSAVNREGVAARLGIVRLAFGVWRSLSQELISQTKTKTTELGYLCFRIVLFRFTKPPVWVCWFLTLPGNRIGTCWEVERTRGARPYRYPPDENKSIRLHPPGDGIAIGLFSRCSTEERDHGLVLVRCQYHAKIDQSI